MTGVFDRRFDRLDGKLDRALEILSAQHAQLAVFETKLGQFEDIPPRLSALEQAAALHRHKRETRTTGRQWFWPTIANGVGVVVSAALATLSLILQGHGGHG